MFKRIVQVSIAAMVLSLFTSVASAETDPFPSVANGGEIPGTRISSSPGVTQSQWEATSTYLAFNCPTGSGRGMGVDLNFTTTNSDDTWYAYCVKTWQSTAAVDAENKYRTDLANAQAIALAQSQEWNAAHPGQQKCFQWGPITSPSGGTSSGGVCANPVGSLPSGVDTSTSTPSIDTRTTTPSVDTRTTTPAPTQNSGTGGYAVVHPDGHVCGVIVANSSDPFGNGGTMPQEYMGCPAGSRIVFQTRPSSDGNVAGVHGQNVIYNNGVFTVLGSDSGTATTIVNGVATDSSGRRYDAGSGQALDPLPNLANGAMVPGTKISSAPGQSQSAWEATAAYRNRASCPVGSGSAIEINLNFTSDRSDDVYSTYCVKNWNGTYSSSVVGAPLADSTTTTTKIDTKTVTSISTIDTSSALIDTKTVTVTKSGIPDPVKEESQLNIAMVGLRSKIAIETDFANSKLLLTASKKGSKTITINVKTDKEGDAAVSTTRNLKGFTVTLTKGKVVLDKDVVR
jgi:hypothetical protein